MAEREQINLKVKPEKKEDWEAFVEDSIEMHSLTQLVRASVGYYINKKEEEEGEITKDFLISQFEQLREGVEDVEYVAKAVSNDQITSEEVSQITLDQDEIQYATLRGNEEFWKAEGVDLSKLPMSDDEEWKR